MAGTSGGLEEELLKTFGFTIFKVSLGVRYDFFGVVVVGYCGVLYGEGERS